MSGRYAPEPDEQDDEDDEDDEDDLEALAADKADADRDTLLAIDDEAER